MSIEERNTIDAIGIEGATGKVILTISDHMSWDDEYAHLLLLQAKLNTYLGCIESGELVSLYPAAAGREVAIDIVCQYSRPAIADQFLRQADELIRRAGYELRLRALA